MRRAVSVFVVSIVVAAALMLVAQNRIEAGVPQAKPQNAEVKIDNFSFTPASITVAAGTTITWTNRDDIPHTVVEKRLSFRSKALDTDNAYSYTFATAGSFDYFCSLHPHMVGKIIVK